MQFGEVGRITPKLYVSYGTALAGADQIDTATYTLRCWLTARPESGIEKRIKLEAGADRE